MEQNNPVVITSNGYPGTTYTTWQYNTDRAPYSEDWNPPYTPHIDYTTSYTVDGMALRKKR